MDNYEQLIEQAKQSELFTAPRLEPDLRAFLNERSEQLQALAREAVAAGVQQIYFVGSGGSWSNMYSGAYLMDQFTDIPAAALMSYDLIWRNPQRLNEKAWVFLASYSGNTEDTVAALRHCKSKGARTIALVSRRDNSTLAKEADLVIDYASTALYIIPLAAVYLFALALAKEQGRGAAVQPIMEGLHALPEVLGRVYRESEAPARDLAIAFRDASLLYVLGAGPLAGLAYKFGLTVFMENIRIHGSYIESAEFRHGPVEMLDRQSADMVFLLGTDPSREMTQRVIDMVRERGKTRTIIYDLKDYADVHPLLGPFVLLIPLQWFAVCSAIVAGIHDLDERAFMGRGILATGGSTWP